MKYLKIHAAMLLIAVAAPGVASAGLMECLKGGGCCAEKVTCCTKCVPEYKTEKVKKHCWCTECDEVCIPPVTLPCCKCLFGGKLCGRGKCGGCSDNCGGCSTCGSDCCSDKCCKNGLLKKVFGCFAGCRTRCVSKLKKHEYECEKCVVEWKCVRSGCCDTGCCQTGACCEPQCCAPGGCQ